MTANLHTEIQIGFIYILEVLYMHICGMRKFNKKAYYLTFKTWLKQYIKELRCALPLALPRKMERICLGEVLV